MRRPSIRLNLMLVVIACIAVYVNLWKVHTETLADRAMRDHAIFGGVAKRRAAVVVLGDSLLQGGGSASSRAWLARRPRTPTRKFASRPWPRWGTTPGPNEQAADALIRVLKQGRAAGSGRERFRGWRG